MGIIFDKKKRHVEHDRYSLGWVQLCMPSCMIQLLNGFYLYHLLCVCLLCVGRTVCVRFASIHPPTAPLCIVRCRHKERTDQKMITSNYRFQLLRPIDSGPQRTIMFEDSMYAHVDVHFCVLYLDTLCLLIYIRLM